MIAWHACIVGSRILILAYRWKCFEKLIISMNMFEFDLVCKCCVMHKFTFILLVLENNSHSVETTNIKRIK